MKNLTLNETSEYLDKKEGYCRLDLELDLEMVKFFEETAKGVSEELGREVVAADIISLIITKLFKDETEVDRLVAAVLEEQDEDTEE